MSAQHTPGPWEFRSDTTSVHSQAELVLTAIVYGENGNQERANGNIIAAAPELLGALEQVWPFLEEDDGCGCNLPVYQAAIDACRIAIALAKGGVK